MNTNDTTPRKPGTDMMIGGTILLTIALILVFAPMNLVLPGFFAFLGFVLLCAGFGRRIIAAIESPRA